MKRIFVFFVLCFAFSMFNANIVSAIDCNETNSCPLINKTAENIENELNNEELKSFVDTFAEYQNKHNITALKRLYSADFVNVDGFNKQQLFDLIEKTYENYPDITSEYKIEEIVRLENYSIITLKQKTQATTKTPSKITGDKGEYNADLRIVMYLKREANSWKIYSEDTLFEYSSIAYGTAKGVKTKLNAPQKVLNGAEYSAGVEVEIPNNFTAIASINSTQIVEGFNLQGESFRQVDLNKGYLERIIKANSLNNNEAVVVSVGFTQQNQDMFKKPKIEISGLLMLMQRVDIIPTTSNLTIQKEKQSAKK